MRVALVGMSVLSEPDHDEAPLLSALRAAGCESEVIAWDNRHDPAHDPAGFDVCLLRATWNYHLRPQAFMRWIDRAARTSLLLNPPEVVRWNMHKRYLLQLAEAGIETIPTICFPKGTEASLSQVLAEREWPEVVIKPAISGASWMTHKFGRGETEEARSFLRDMLRERDMLAQPYVSEFVQGGELAMVWIDGRITHAVRKQPRFHGGEERVSPWPALSERHVRFAERVIDAAGQDAVYARVDAIQRADGSLMLSELEMIEPSLFLDHSKEALNRLVDAVMRLSA